jgi:hypothetical protein
MTDDDKHVIDLVERAAERAGSMNKLAKALHIAESAPRGWKALTRPFSPEDRMRVAAIAGDDAIAELARAMIAKHEGTPKGDQLRLLLGNVLRHSGAAVASVLLALGSLTFLPTPANAQAMVRALDTMCRRVKLRPRFL